MKKLLYFSPVFWSSYKQRPHFVIEYFLAKGYEVLWVEPYPTRLPKWNDIFRRAKLFDQATPVPPGLTTLQLKAVPIEPLTGLNRLNLWVLKNPIAYLRAWLPAGGIIGVGKPNLVALTMLKEHRGFSFYDAMDNLPAFHRGVSRWYLGKIERAIAHQVAKVVVSSSWLEQKFSQQRLPVIKMLNALDSGSFAKPIAVNRRELILGYIGTIAEWFDWPLVIHIAKKCPWLSICLIGPVFAPVPFNLPANIAILPPITHAEVSQYLSEFTLGLIPFKRNALTSGVDPIKYYEYRAMGLPVITTHFGEMACRQDEAGVFIVNADNAVAAIHAALQHADSFEQVTAFRRQHAWSQRLIILNEENI